MVRIILSSTNGSVFLTVLGLTAPFITTVFYDWQLETRL